MRALRLLVRFADRLSTAVGWAISVLVPAMVVVIGYEVVARYYFNAPTIWAHDLSIFMFGYLGLLAGAYVQRRRRHITVDVLYMRLPPRQQAALDAASGLLAFFFLGLVAVYGWREAMEALRIGTRLSTEWAPPKGHFMLMIPVSAGLLVVQGLADWLRSLYLAVTGRTLEA